MKQQIFLCLSLFIDGTTGKALQLKMPLESIYNQSFCFDEQKYIFEYIRKIKIIKTFKIT
jgi:hypothetical protein